MGCGPERETGERQTERDRERETQMERQRERLNVWCVCARAKLLYF